MISRRTLTPTQRLRRIWHKWLAQSPRSLLITHARFAVTPGFAVELAKELRATHFHRGEEPSVATIVDGIRNSKLTMFGVPVRVHPARVPSAAWVYFLP